MRLDDGRLPKRERRSNALLEDVVESIFDAPVRERAIRHPQFFIFGEHDVATGAITLNVPLLRVMLFLHEGTHRVRPEWTERTVRARSRQLLDMLDDNQIAELNAQLVAAIALER